MLGNPLTACVHARQSFSREELTQIAKLLEKHPNITVVADEVYDCIQFSKDGHTRFASLPGMCDTMFPRTFSGLCLTCGIVWCGSQV